MSREDLLFDSLNCSSKYDKRFLSEARKWENNKVKISKLNSRRLQEKNINDSMDWETEDEV